jgi:hypothetical protein
MSSKYVLNGTLVLIFFFVLSCGNDNEGVDVNNEESNLVPVVDVPSMQEMVTYAVPLERELPEIQPLPSHDLWPLFTADGSFPEKEESSIAITIDGRLWLYVQSPNFSEDLNDLEAFTAWSTSDGITWIPVTEPYPISVRNGHAIYSNGSLIYLLGGGYIDGIAKSLSDFWTSTDGITWERISESVISDSISLSQISIFEESLYVTGGYNSKTSERLDSVWKSLNGLTWESINDDLPFEHPLGKHTTLSTNDYLFILANDGILRSIDGATWEEIPAFTTEGEDLGYPPNRKDFNAVWFQDRLIVLGGKTRSPLYEDFVRATDVWASPDGESWEQIAPKRTLPGRDNMILTVFKGKLFLIGGIQYSRDQEPEWIREVWVSDDGVTWDLLAQDPTQQPVSTK